MKNCWLFRIVQMRLKGKFQLRFSIRLLQNEEAVRPERKHGGKVSPTKQTVGLTLAFIQCNLRPTKYHYWEDYMMPWSNCELWFFLYTGKQMVHVLQSFFQLLSRLGGTKISGKYCLLSSDKNTNHPIITEYCRKMIIQEENNISIP